MRQTLPGSISGAVTSLYGSGHPLSAPSEATWTTKQIKTEIYHEKSFDVLITTTNINRLTTAYGKVICNFYTFNDRSPPISLSRRCIFTFFHGHLDFWACSWQISDEASKNLTIYLSKLLSLKEVKKLLRNVFFFFFFFFFYHWERGCSVVSLNGK